MTLEPGLVASRLAEEHPGLGVYCATAEGGGGRSSPAVKGRLRELSNRFGAPGDFAQAYVIAHEIGHHVQQQTGIEQEVRQLQQSDPSRQNDLSVRMELQADCLAGVWGQSVYEQGDLDAGDVDEGLAAASAVGDDRIQASAGVGVNPETWTHGSAEQRSTWFRKGFDTGDPAACDTFGQ